MKLTMSVGRVAFVGLFLWARCLGFSSAARSTSCGGSGGNRQRLAKLTRTTAGRSRLRQPQQAQRDPLAFLAKGSSNHDISTMAQDRNIPVIVFKLNSSTKWFVTLANTIGIWTRLDRFEGPFVVVGAIWAVYFTDALKRVLNHDRPSGSPFSDPGMPSSHSLVSYFLAVAWSTLAFPSSAVAGGLLWTSASAIALLRVICGYHSWAQIGVGAVLGAGMGLAWAKLGASLAATTHGNAKLVFRASWGLYLLGSALFVTKNMRDWLQKDRHI